MDRRKIAAFAVGPLASAALGLVTLPVVAWLYPAEDVGRVAMLNVVSSFCVLLFSLGLDQAYVREYHEAGNRPALLKAAVLPGLVLLLLALLVALMSPGLLSRSLFGVDSALFSLVAASCFLFTFLSRFLSLVLRMQEKGLAFSMSQLLPKLLFISLLGGYVLLSAGFSFASLLLAHALSIMLTTLVFGWNTRLDWLPALAQSLDRMQLAGMLRFGAPLILGGAAFWGLTSMDKLLLRHLSTFAELGVYSVAVSFAAAAVIVQNVFSTVWAPTVYRWHAEGIDPARVDRITDYVLLVIVAVLSLVGLFSWIIPWLLPAQYGDVQFLVLACMAYPLFYTLSETTAVGLGITRNSGYAMAASLVAAGVNFLGCYWLVPSLGAAGAAISTACAFWVFLLCRTEFSSKVWRQLPRRRLYTITLLCLLAAIIFTLAGRDHHPVFSVVWMLLILVVALPHRSEAAALLRRARGRRAVTGER
jgi:O-antigen/teichoic acid export membrane protein